MNDSISKNEISANDHIDSLIDITLDIQELIWQDSTNVKFLTITHIDRKYDQKHSNYGVTKKYRKLGGPIIVGNRYRDSCFIYPIMIKRNTSFFLLDDFIHLTDSLITLSISVSIGEYDQGQEITFFEHPSLMLCEVVSTLESIEPNPKDKLATTEWYQFWVEANPYYRDFRKRNIDDHCK